MEPPNQQEPTKPTDVRVTGVELYLLPVYPRVPLKFGRETLTFVNCARVRVTVADRAGATAEGWGETPLSVQWSARCSTCQSTRSGRAHREP